MKPRLMFMHYLPNHYGDTVARHLRFGWDTYEIAQLLMTDDEIIDETHVYNFIASYGGIKRFLDEWPAE